MAGEVTAGASPERSRRGWSGALRRAAPLRLLRHPALVAAIAAGSLLLALAAAAYPLFMSATTSDLVRSAVDRPTVTRYGAGITFTFRDLPLGNVELFGRSGRGITPPTFEEMDEPFRELASGSPTLGPPVAAILGDPVAVSAGGEAAEQEGRLFSSTGVLEAVEVVAGEDGDGVWLPDLIATQLDVGPGDTVRLNDLLGGPAASVRVDGIYRAIYATPAGGYWLPWAREFQLSCLDCGPPPQPILADRDQVLALADDLRQGRATFRFVAPLAEASISLEQARSLESFTRRAEDDLTYPDGRLSSDFACCQRYFYQARNGVGFGTALTTFGSSIGFVVDDAEKRIVAVEGPARVLALAGLAVAFVVVAAAGAFSVRARRVEAAWWFARGRSATYVGAKSAVETLLPSVLGGALGFGLAVWAVSTLGPSGPVDGSVYVDAALATTLAILGAVALTAFVAARTYVRVVDPHGRRFARMLSVVPWELGIIALAIFALQRLREGGAFITDESLDVVRPSLALVAFPFLLFAGFALLAARLARYGFVWLRRPTASAPPAPYVATRRLAGGGTFTMLLVGGAGLCLGTFLHAQIVSRSLQTSVEAKAQVFAGSDVTAQVIATAQVPEDFPMPATRVLQVGEGARLASGRTLDLLAIDPATFPDAAYWNDAFSDRSLEDLVQELDSGEEGEPLPVILAAGPDVAVDEVLIGTASVPVEVIARPSAFPGLYSLRPLLVVAEDRLVERLDLPYNPLARFGAELWIRGDPDEIGVALARLSSPPFAVITAEAVEDIPHVAAAIDTFVVVNVLGMIAAALTFVGMLMYLQARQRSQVVSYALSSRMGMRHGQHRRALVLELGVMLAWSFAIGAVLSLVAARFTVPLLDPITVIPPAPFLVVPYLLTAAAASLLAALVWLGATVTNRRARSVDLGEVMRVAE